LDHLAGRALLCLVGGLLAVSLGTPGPAAAGWPSRGVDPDLPAHLSYEGGFVDLGETRLFYRRTGDGPVNLLCLPGGPGGAFRGDEAEWLRLGDLATVYLLDLRGTGFSDRLTEVGKGSLEQDVEDLEAVRQALGLRSLSLYGHSYGATLALFYTLKYGEAVDRLVLAGYLVQDTTAVTGGARDEVAAMVRLLEERENRLLERYPELQQQIGKILSGGPGEERQVAFEAIARDPRLRGFVGELMILTEYRNSPAQQRPRLDRLGVHPLATQMSLEVLLAHLANGSRDPSDEELTAVGRLGRPTLIVTGRESGGGMEVVSSTRLQGLLPGSRLLVLEHSGHGIESRDQDHFLKAMRRFLEGKDDEGR
jgi:pimeloyl-ACP methyl ester carboxylesterase